MFAINMLGHIPYVLFSFFNEVNLRWLSKADVLIGYQTAFQKGSDNPLPPAIAIPTPFSHRYFQFFRVKWIQPYLTYIKITGTTLTVFGFLNILLCVLISPKDLLFHKLPFVFGSHFSLPDFFPLFFCSSCQLAECSHTISFSTFFPVPWTLFSSSIIWLLILSTAFLACRQALHSTAK